MKEFKTLYSAAFLILCFYFVQSKAADSEGYCGDDYQTSGFNARKIDAFHAFDEKNLVIACSGGLAYIDAPKRLLTSNNGGKNWIKRFEFEKSYIDKFIFLDRKTGFVFGTYFPTRNQSKALILKTTDGGETWQKISNEISEVIEDAQFIDNRNGWIVTDAGNFYQTSDGGNTWARINEKPFTTKEISPARMSFADQNSGWLISFEREWINNRNDVILDGDIYQTEDSGKTWRSRKEIFTALLQQWRPTEIRFQAIKFVDSKRGYVAAHFEQIQRKLDDGNRYQIYFGGVIFTTQNGGESWKANIITTDLGLITASFSANGKFWVIPVKVSQTDFIYSSIDGGKSWKNRSTEFTDGGRPSEIYFVNDKIGFMIADLGMNSDDIYRTTNGGKTWQKR